MKPYRSPKHYDSPGFFLQQIPIFDEVLERVAGRKCQDGEQHETDAQQGGNHQHQPAQRQFVVPVQAKGGNDQLGSVQAKQDMACCAEKFPGLVCRPIAAQFMDDERIAIFELTIEGDQIKVVDETHYQLVPRDMISDQDLETYRARR